MSDHDVEAVASSLALLTTQDGSNNRYEQAISMTSSAFTRFRVRNTKTVAVLLSGAQTPMHAAVSGWSTWIHSLPGFTQISQEVALREVNKLMAQVRHPLCADEKDQGVLGRYHACHAERLLIAHCYLGTGGLALFDIMISQAPCPDCWDFLARLELVLGLEITVFVGDTRLGEERERSLFHVWLSNFADFE
jgi:hypothetical protein